MLDYIRIACAVPAVKVGDVKKNTEDICAYLEKADTQNVDIVVFPELAMTGYTCGDLFGQRTLLDIALRRDILGKELRDELVVLRVGKPDGNIL